MRVEAVNPPKWAAKAKSAAARRGYAYERKVGKWLGKHAKVFGWELLDHQWFLLDGSTYRQPDFVLHNGTSGIVFEVKLTLVDTVGQLTEYQELLQAYGLRCTPVTVTRHLTPAVNADTVVACLENIFPMAVLHLWL